MEIRQRVPRILQPAFRNAYLAFGSRTSRLRMDPSFIVIGGQRCGTTTIFKSLAEHPQVVRPPVDKGTDYYTLHYRHDLDWYRGHFPIRSGAQRRAAEFGPPMAFEACTYYMFHPLAMERIAKDYPDVKLVAMLRNPVQRAYSAYKHEFARGFEPESDFERALDLEDSRLEGEIDRIWADVDYESHAHRHQAYRHRGQFAEQLERVLEHFSREQLHVMESEAFFADPAGEYQRLLDFLGLARWEPRQFERHNARPSSPMPEAAKARLVEHYRPHDARLAEILGRPPYWAT
jgi:Sulfotransferase domain